VREREHAFRLLHGAGVPPVPGKVQSVLLVLAA
jgi:hypothetical protein